jgi:hypothetical protein
MQAKEFGDVENFPFLVRKENKRAAQDVEGGGMQGERISGMWRTFRFS